MRVFYHAYSLTTLTELISIVDKKYGWKAIYCTVDRSSVSACLSEFPDTIVHSIQEARRCVPRSDFKPARRFGLIPSDLDKLKNFDTTFYYMADRMDRDGWQFSFSQRKNFLYYVLRYWCDTLVDLKIKFVMSRNIPHFSAEYALYIACQI